MNPTLRHIASILLLATYLPMVVLSSLHVHHDTVDVQDDCRQCVGHFESGHNHNSDCLYCHFQGQSYLGTVTAQTAVVRPADKLVAICQHDSGTLCRYGVAALRAPPVEM